MCPYYTLPIYQELNNLRLQKSGTSVTVLNNRIGIYY